MASTTQSTQSTPVTNEDWVKALVDQGAPQHIAEQAVAEWPKPGSTKP
jgi:hypothetical protein